MTFGHCTGKGAADTLQAAPVFFIAEVDSGIGLRAGRSAVRPKGRIRALKAYYESAPWRGIRALSGGGSLINQALHTLDLLQWFCGMPETVTGNAFNHTLGGVIDVEDGTFGVYSYADGRRFVLASTNACNDSFPVNIALRTEKRLLQMTDDYLVEDGKIVETRDDFPVPAKKEWGNGHLRLISEFYRCLGLGEKFPIDFYEGSKVVRLILALYASDGKPIGIAKEK